MRISINGQPASFDGEMTVAELLVSRDIASVRVAVEINEDIVPRKTFANTVIHDGDRIEIVTFVGGG